MTPAFMHARAALIALALMGASPAQAADMAVKIDNFTFTPDTAEIAVGTTVVWTNDDDIPHALAATERQFKSHALDTGDSFSYTFTASGTYEYFCSLHPHMKGKIVVK
jgi:plastocyanin